MMRPPVVWYRVWASGHSSARLTAHFSRLNQGCTGESGPRLGLELRRLMTLRPTLSMSVFKDLVVYRYQ